MSFTSIDFAIFLPIVFLIYWFVVGKNLRSQNMFVVLASYIFYGWWDWRFLSLIISSTCFAFITGHLMGNQTSLSKRRVLLWLAVIINIGLLGFFKYFNFFIENISGTILFFGLPVQLRSLRIVLPIGISFYTFQILSYIVDIYRNRIVPSKDYFAFSAYVAFFPQLVAGPIERATNLLPQFYIKRNFNYEKSVDGLRQVLWGLFKKIVIADNSAEFVDAIFSNPASYPASMLFAGAVFFSFQIYGDFSGYSDIAIGLSRLFGFNLEANFKTPYFSRDIAEFWRRWHISLTSWFKDYVYIPLGGSRGNIWHKISNTFIVIVLSGFWHGANWTFIIWGAINALWFIPLLLLKRNRSNIEIVAKGKLFPSITDSISIISTFLLVSFSWIFFRAENINRAIAYISGCFSVSLFSLPDSALLAPDSGTGRGVAMIPILIFFIIIEWFGREKPHPLALVGNFRNRPIRWAIYLGIIIFMFAYTGNQQEFIYFQF